MKIEPLRYTIIVGCPVHDAFRIWTEETSTWWPASHTVFGRKGVEVFFEGREGGRIFERSPTGDEAEWGVITLWDPPRRLGYLWRIRTDLASATDVVIEFIDQGDRTTRVEIEHAGWERLGNHGPAWRDTNRGGWDGVLPVFASACNRIGLHQSR